MSSCKLDHPLEDVLSKLDSQKSFLPAELFEECQTFLATNPTQLELNELFHLLKKYDLASEEEQLTRNEAIANLLTA
ncbi:group-specific protein [Halalkalibacter alkaliphilus]|uniref:Group-specific protein n=1 Tax=Halalkalibacter alkaliphilus TaxID=2917993 RepID=A0A9X2CWU0_9BACI|nr:group-specific protein [Halalkalibacter alkaliphilus]MCL7749540.1 group-specific protein [Halalkalibacter alkaliphilus]